ncbi:arginyltransferase [Psychromonas antarctica]|uniref:arginyltransferase n=1 Tax=Psychromonas antarctica TaxID=67573 RepID=UPI001EE8EE88|nr:arginyltransferase [Psychromonas antarctica]MCG6199887.1 arginyltransferase [Psychromonas antarctica]
MSTQKALLNVAISDAFPCSYLSDQQEQLLLLIDPQLNGRHFYPTLLANGFRRNGDQLYRPHCRLCQECQSLRTPVQQFKASRSQKRLNNKNKKFRVQISTNTSTQYFSLYQNYINKIHKDGPMFPASVEQYDDFINSTWNEPLFIEIYDQEKLISVSVTDQVKSKKNQSWSAFYCFYDPTYQHYSLGKFAILSQLKLAKKLGIDWLYLGYYIEKCQKMNYKTGFMPHQRFIGEQWFDFN